MKTSRRRSRSRTRGVSPVPSRRGWVPEVLGIGVLAAAALLATALPARGQGNLRQPPSEIERYLEGGQFSVDTLRGARYPADPTKQAILAFADGPRILVKWAPAPKGGEEFNAVPRYDEAVYRLQQLFLDEDDYVVPPTVCRCVAPWLYRPLDPDIEVTFGETDCILVVLQAWLWAVTDEDVFVEDRFRSDTAYARHLANTNVLTYLVDHKDANKGNVLVSEDPDRPRVWVVDNSVAFDSEKSDRGDDWGDLRVDRIPAETARRLRGIDREMLHGQLATLAQFEARGDRGMVRVEPGEPLDPGDGIRRSGDTLQLGLTDGEIDDVYDRLEELIERLEDGDVTTF